MLASTQNKGFRMTFQNGYTISVQFGKGNYCHNRHSTDNPKEIDVYNSKDAEVAVWDSNHNNVEVSSYCSADEVAEFINKVKNW
jgi:hypothetical protein